MDKEETFEVRRALLSVSEKRGLTEFALELQKLEVEIVSTGGTARTLRDAGLSVVEVSEVTGFPEMLEGRVKTLHPRIHGGILARRDRKGHMMQLQEHGIRPIDLVVVNLYPFERTVARPGCTMEEAVEQIDIGGPCLIRAAAKNHDAVAVVVDPDDYGVVAEELQKSGGKIRKAMARALAVKAFELTSKYDAAIASYLRDRVESY